MGQNQKKDTSQKTMEWYNDIFADIVNVIIFNGKRVVREEHLSEADPHSQYKTAGDIYAQSRDISKYWSPGKVTISLIGLENQTGIDQKMPLRVMSYDGASYRNQLRGNDVPPPYPVITLVLYFGTDRLWDRPLSLYDCFEIDPRMDPFVSDYHINVVNVAFLPPDVIRQFQSDFRYIADFLHQRRTTGTYRDRIGKPMLHMEELIDALDAFTGDNRSETAYNVNNLKENRKELRNPMSSQDVQMFIDGLAKHAEEQAAERGFAQGQERGFAQGQERGFAQGFARGVAKREALSEERGKALGETAVQTLGSRMRKDGRTEEFLNAMDDRDLLSALLKEYKL